jgi:hypothetical protein
MRMAPRIATDGGASISGLARPGLDAAAPARQEDSPDPESGTRVIKYGILTVS